MKHHPRLSFKLPAVHIDAGNLHGCVRLAMSVQLLVLLLALEVEDQDLVAAALPDYLAGDEGASTACPVRLRSR